jgi:hypothetical protein
MLLVKVLYVEPWSTLLGDWEPKDVVDENVLLAIT